jgi:cobalamin-dependent methionine synthase I
VPERAAPAACPASSRAHHRRHPFVNVGERTNVTGSAKFKR